jgi:ATP-dependent 26S proteasome regulatory subunit
MIIGLALFILFWVWFTINASDLFYKWIGSGHDLEEILFIIAVGISPVVVFLQYLDSTGRLKA